MQAKAVHRERRNWTRIHPYSLLPIILLLKNNITKCFCSYSATLVAIQLPSSVVQKNQTCKYLLLYTHMKLTNAVDVILRIHAKKFLNSSGSNSSTARTPGVELSTESIVQTVTSVS